MTKWVLPPDRCFDPNPSQRACARELYEVVADEPIVSPHGHVDPALLADPASTFGTPADLFVIADHYVCRILYSQGLPLEDLGVPSRDGTPVELDHRRVWQRFADNFDLFNGTPSGLWLREELIGVFDVTEKLCSANAQDIYTHVQMRLASPDYAPRALFARFGIEHLCTTDAASSSLASHRDLHRDGWGGRVHPTFRPDAVIAIDAPDWQQQIRCLEETSGVSIADYASFIRALETQRARFRGLGAVATDQAAVSAHTEWLGEREINDIFQRALRGACGPDDAALFTAHMLLEMARMSVEDGLVMQLRVGSYRNHNADIHRRFGPDNGGDMPVRVDWTRQLHTLLNMFGNDRRLRLILFTLDESTYTRELAPLAGFYPALVLGPPWWFLDSVNGMHRYLDGVVETAGIRNLAGFNDDTRAFCSIPARHTIWRRVSCNWLAGQVERGIMDRDEAREIARELAVELARRAYNLNPRPADSALAPVLGSRAANNAGLQGRMSL